MPEGHSPQFERALEALQKQGPLKTWSLIVTLFGDLAPRQTQALESQFLQHACVPFGVKPEALRVALHRLRKDDWIKAQKHGRHMSYQLTELGQKATSEAYERIYRGAAQAPESWMVTLAEDARTCGNQESVLVAPNITAALERPASDADVLTVKTSFDAVPTWMKSAIVDTQTASEFAEFEAVIRKITPPETEASKLCLRLLVLHYWRRLLLRQDDLPELLLGPDWPGYGARLQTTGLLATLKTPETTALNVFDSEKMT